MKKTKMVAVLSALVLGLVITSCGNPSSGSLPEVTKDTLSENLIDLEGYTLKVGDLIMSNDKVLPYSEDYTEEEWKNFDSTKPVAVIFREANGETAALGVGLQQPTMLAWAVRNTPGYNTNFESIQCKPSSWGVWNSSKTWTGDTDGSDNWEQIKAYFEDSSKSENKAEEQNPEKYPAFNYALTYGTTASLIGTYADNWFLPSIAELVEIYTSKEKVNKVLNALGSKAQVIEEGLYWSSSQNCDYHYCAVALELSNGNILNYNYNKNFDNGYVCVVRAF